MKKFLCFIMCVAMFVTAFGGAVSALADSVKDCKIGTKEYNTLAEAISEVTEGQTIELLKNIEISGDILISNTVAFTVASASQRVTLTVNDGSIASKDKDTSCNVTFQNINFVENAANASKAKSIIVTRGRSTFTFENCSFTVSGYLGSSANQNNAYFNADNYGGTLNMVGCTIISNETAYETPVFAAYASSVNYEINLTDVTVTVSNGNTPVFALFGNNSYNEEGDITTKKQMTVNIGGETYFKYVDASGEQSDHTNVFCDTGHADRKGGTVNVFNSKTYCGYSAPAMIDGASIRTSEPSGLRFSATIPANTIASSYGILLAKYDTIGDDDFTYEALTASKKKCIAYDAVDGKIISGDNIRFNITLKNIEDYSVNYAARAYANYDVGHAKVKVYSSFTADNARSVAYVASEALGDLKESVTECDDGYDYKYLIDGKYSRYTKSEYGIIQKISLEKGDKPMWRFSEDASTGIVVRDVEINTGKGGDAVEIIQITDIHFNYCTDEDLQNETLKSTWEKHAFLKVQKNDGIYSNVESKYHSIRNIESCLEYVNNENPDQLIVTGDIMSYLSAGNIELAKHYIFDPYPTVMACLGNHEPLQQMQGTVKESVSFEDRMAALSDAWPHDMYYTSKVIDEKVMAVVMDNGSANGYGAFTAEQVTKLTADLALAREKGYTVLLFYHIPLATENAAYKNTHAVSYNGKGDANTKIWDYETKGINSTYDGATGDMYKLITSNGYIIAATFCGHKHNDYYTEINATDPDGIKTTIPQYILIGTFYGSGNALRITVN